MFPRRYSHQERHCFLIEKIESNDMAISHGRLVLVSSTHYCAYTPSLSSDRFLYRSPFRETRSLRVAFRGTLTGTTGTLILGCASRLDAFSGYHVAHGYPANTSNEIAGTPEVLPTRSSRTRVRPPQGSYAHSR